MINLYQMQEKGTHKVTMIGSRAECQGVINRANTIVKYEKFEMVPATLASIASQGAYGAKTFYSLHKPSLEELKADLELDAFEEAQSDGFRQTKVIHTHSKRHFKPELTSKERVSRYLRKISGKVHKKIAAKKA